MKTSHIELQKENMSFAAGHFTIFSETERENLHGHNYQVYVSLRFEYCERGLSFDYRVYKNKLYALCDELNHITLIPGNSKYLTIEENETGCIVTFNKEQLTFLKRDYKIIPLTNITVEELSNWFIQQLLKNPEELNDYRINAIDIKVFSGPGQSGSAHWQRSTIEETA